MEPTKFDVAALERRIAQLQKKELILCEDEALAGHMLQLQRDVMVGLAPMMNGLLPMARQLELISADDGLIRVMDRLISGEFDLPDTDDPHLEPKRKVAIMFWGALSAWLIELEIPRDENTVRGVGREALRWYPFAWGYMEAICDVRNATSRRGTGGKRKKGDATREKLKAAALPYRSRNVKRSRAAELIAPHMALSVSRTYDLLRELHSEKEWPIPAPSVSSEDS